MKFSDCAQLRNDATAIAVYNADEKVLVGVFATARMAGQFVYGSAKFDHDKAGAQVLQYARRKNTVLPKSSQHPFRIAVRRATALQTQDLNKEGWALKDESLKPFLKTMSILNRYDNR